MKRSSVVFFLFLALCATAFADPILDFNVSAPASGSISYSGGANPLVGTNISVDTIAGIATPSSSGVVHNLIGGVLNFQTGNLVSSSPTDYYFAGGGSITLDATCADLNGNNTCDTGDAFGNMLTGTFLGAHVTSGANGFRVDISDFTDTKNETLAEYYGLGSVTSWLGNTNISFYVPGGTVAPDAFSSVTVLSGDITNTPSSSVPEPGSLLLLGSGLLGTWTTKRRRKA